MHTRRRPQVRVRPPLDATLLFVKDEDGTASDQSSLVVSQSTIDLGHDASSNAFEDEESIVCTGTEDWKKWQDVAMS